MRRFASRPTSPPQFISDFFFSHRGAPVPTRRRGSTVRHPITRFEGSGFVVHWLDNKYQLGSCELAIDAWGSSSVFFEADRPSSTRLTDLQHDLRITTLAFLTSFGPLRCLTARPTSRSVLDEPHRIPTRHSSRMNSEQQPTKKHHEDISTLGLGSAGGFCCISHHDPVDPQYRSSTALLKPHIANSDHRHNIVHTRSSSASLFVMYPFLLR